MRVKPKHVRAAYTYLLVTEPFKNWRLPKPADMKFKVNCSHKVHGWAEYKTISVSRHFVRTTSALMELVAHEMIHVWELQASKKVGHGRVFQKAARKVCLEHGFDPRTF